MTTLPNKPPANLGKKYIRGTAPCTGGCGRMTRSTHMKVADHPGTLQRSRNGLCIACVRPDRKAARDTAPALKLPILECTAPNCDALTRSTVDNPDLAPGTRRRLSGGLCSECYKNREEQVSEKQVRAAKS